MSQLEEDKVLFAYIVAAPHTVSLVLIQVDDGVQKPVYYVSKSLHEADYTGWITKWGTILGAFDIKYMPRTSIKGQVLADLVAEFTESTMEEDKEKQCMDEKLVGVVSLQEPLLWRVYVDGAANQMGSGVGLVVVFPERIVIEKSLRLGFSAMNNEAKYETLLVGMAMV